MPDPIDTDFYCPCAKTCHFDGNPCSLSCLVHDREVLCDEVDRLRAENAALDASE